MANAIPQLAWIARADGYIYWYNERWYAYTGTTPEQMEGWGWQSVHDPALLPKVLEQWKASIASGQEFDMEFPLRGADGLYRQFLTRGFPLKDAKGQVLQWFGTNTDITERKRMEKTLLAKDAELQLIADATPTLLTRLSRDLHYVFVNRACAEMFGRTREEIVGKPIVEIMGKEAFEEIRPYVEKVLSGQRVEYETEIPYQGVGSRFMHAVYIPERNGQGEVVGWLASISDITERKRREDHEALTPSIRSSIRPSTSTR